jgi:gamma-glutamylcyclotransferase (GGCT)/AIG2-like uncharacterized protein YtfP
MIRRISVSGSLTKGRPQMSAHHGPQFLFAYGTLVPRDPTERTLLGWVADAVQGRLYDLGPYPGLVNIDDPTAPWIEGFVSPITEHELIHRLDPYEAVDDGLYQRVMTTSRNNVRVWVYIYARPLPSNARPIEVWSGPSGHHTAPSIDRNASALEVSPGGES